MATTTVTATAPATVMASSTLPATLLPMRRRPAATTTPHPTTKDRGLIIDDSPAKSNCRLLWRGSFVSEQGAKLHGIAIVAHLPPFPTSGSFAFADDPFSPFSPRVANGLTETCLSLEVLRGRDLSISGGVKLRASSGAEATSEPSGRKGQKARLASLMKGKAKADPEIEIECESDVRVYVDPRCSKTKEWLTQRLCRAELDEQGRTKEAFVVSLGDSLEGSSTDVIIFGQRPRDNADAASTSDELPPLQLLLGVKKAPPKPRVPRPDDPLPRENLFAQQLRRTASQPDVTFPPPTKSLVRSKTLSSIRRRSDQPPKAGPPTSRNPFGKVSASPENDVPEAVARGKKTLSTPGRRGEKRPARGNAERDTVMLKRPKLETVSEEYTLAPLPEFDPFLSEQPVLEEPAYVPIPPLSPSPSAVSIPGSRASRSRFPSNGSDIVAQAPSNGRLTGSKVMVQRHLGLAQSRKSGLSRSTSLPPGAFPGLPTRTGSVPPPDDGESWEDKNKITIRRLALTAITARGIEKTSIDFRDLYGAVCKGVQFALRSDLGRRAIDRTAAQGFVEGHLAMYLPPLSVVEKVMRAMQQPQSAVHY